MIVNYLYLEVAYHIYPYDTTITLSRSGIKLSSKKYKSKKWDYISLLKILCSSIVHHFHCNIKRLSSPMTQKATPSTKVRNLTDLNGFDTVFSNLQSFIPHPPLALLDLDKVIVHVLSVVPFSYLLDMLMIGINLYCYNLCTVVFRVSSVTQ